ncbi:MAG: hypothetical protein V3T53_00570 [Phycisphaerales bacterium]
MTDNEKEQPEPYSVEDHGKVDPQSEDPARRSAQVEPGEGVEPLELEPDDGSDEPADGDNAASETEEPPKSSVKALDVCPNCGATMREGNLLVCLRCGFDLKTLRVLETQTGQEIQEEDEEEAEPPEPLSQPGRGDFLVPSILAGISVLLISIGYLVGADGLFNLKSEDGFPIDPAAAQRFGQWGVYLATLVLGSLCGLAGVFVVARLNETTFGDWRLGSLRIVAIFATLWLAKFVDLGGGFVELSAEWILHAGIFVGLSMYFFRLTPRDGATAGLSALLLAAVFWGLAAIIT